MNIFPLNIKNLNYMSGDKKILKDINLITSEKKITIIAGNNGSGKSTLLKILHGIIQHTSGTINWGEIPAHEVRKKQSMVFQNPILLYRTTFENISFALEVLGFDEKEIDEKTNTLIELVDLENSMYKFPNQLSGGEQTRACIARALASNPLLLLCDEPTGNLDPDLSIQIISLLEKINRAGTTVLMATHDSSIVNRRKKRVLQLSNGKLVSDVEKGRYI